MAVPLTVGTRRARAERPWAAKLALLRPMVTAAPTAEVARRRRWAGSAARLVRVATVVAVTLVVLPVEPAFPPAA